MSNVRVNYVSDDKKHFIDELKKHHRVAMVGDAANDTLAIAASDFGIAVKSMGGDAMTQQEAGAVIQMQSESLLPVASAFAVAKQTVSNIKQSLILSLSYNLGAMLIASGLLVTLNPGVGVALMILQTSLILFNAYRFKQQKLSHLEHVSSTDAFPEKSSYYNLIASKPRAAVTLQQALEEGKAVEAKAISPPRPVVCETDEEWILPNTGISF